MWLAAILSGLVFGLAFGLTGVGSIFAVPLLVYAIGLPPHQAVCVAMLSVTALSLVLTAWNWRGAELEHRAGLTMATLGVVGAPLGAWLGRMLSGQWLMFLFACFAALVAARLMSRRKELSLPGVKKLVTKESHRVALASAGFATGILSGLLGMGGLLIVPSLVLLARIEIHRAIKTSLLVVCTVGTAAVSSHLLIGQTIPVRTTGIFLGAGAVAMCVGRQIGNALSPRRLEVIFAVVLAAVAAFVFVRSLL